MWCDQASMGFKSHRSSQNMSYPKYPQVMLMDRRKLAVVTISKTSSKHRGRIPAKPRSRFAGGRRTASFSAPARVYTDQESTHTIFVLAHTISYLHSCICNLGVPLFRSSNPKLRGEHLPLLSSPVPVPCGWSEAFNQLEASLSKQDVADLQVASNNQPGVNTHKIRQDQKELWSHAQSAKRKLVPLDLRKEVSRPSQLLHVWQSFPGYLRIFHLILYT